jgi:hypothetical protein
MAHFPAAAAPQQPALQWPQAPNPVLALPYAGSKALLAPRSPGASLPQPADALAGGPCSLPYEGLLPGYHTGGAGHGAGLGSPGTAPGRTAWGVGLGHGLPLLVPPAAMMGHGAPLGAALNPSRADPVVLPAVAAGQQTAAEKGRGWPAPANTAGAIAAPQARRSRRRRQGS